LKRETGEFGQPESPSQLAVGNRWELHNSRYLLPTMERSSFPPGSHTTGAWLCTRAPDEMKPVVAHEAH